MNKINEGIFKLSEDLVINSQYTFGQFELTRYFDNQAPNRVIWIKSQFNFNEHIFFASLFFRNMKIYMLSLVACDKDFDMKEEENRKDYHDDILKSWGIEPNTSFCWGNITSSYDRKSNISSIDIVFI